MLFQRLQTDSECFKHHTAGLYAVSEVSRCHKNENGMVCQYFGTDIAVCWDKTPSLAIAKPFQMSAGYMLLERWVGTVLCIHSSCLGATKHPGESTQSQYEGILIGRGKETS